MGNLNRVYNIGPNPIFFEFDMSKRSFIDGDHLLFSEGLPEKSSSTFETVFWLSHSFCFHQTVTDEHGSLEKRNNFTVFSLIKNRNFSVLVSQWHGAKATVLDFVYLLTLQRPIQSVLG